MPALTTNTTEGFAFTIERDAQTAREPRLSEPPISAAYGI
jgi:hypothetical protein